MAGDKKPTRKKKLTGPEYRPNAGCGVKGFGAGREVVPVREKLVSPAVVESRRDAAELFDPHVDDAMMVFVNCMHGDGTSEDRVRMMAAKEVLDRVFGKPAVKHEIKSASYSITMAGEIQKVMPQDKAIEMTGWILEAKRLAALKEAADIEGTTPYNIQRGAEKKAANQKTVDDNREVAKKAREAKMKGTTDADK